MVLARSIHNKTKIIGSKPWVTCLWKLNDMYWSHFSRVLWKVRKTEKTEETRIKGYKLHRLKIRILIQVQRTCIHKLDKKQLYVFIPTLKISYKKPCEGKFPSHMTTNSILFIDRGLIPLLFYWYINNSFIFKKSFKRNYYSNVYTFIKTLFNFWMPSTDQCQSILGGVMFFKY